MKKRFISLFLCFAVCLTAFSSVSFAAVSDPVDMPSCFYYSPKSSWLLAGYDDLSLSSALSIGFYPVTNASFTNNLGGQICPIMGVDNATASTHPNTSSGYFLGSPIVSGTADSLKVSFTLFGSDDLGNKFSLYSFKDMISFSSLTENVTGVCFRMGKISYGSMYLSCYYRVVNISTGKVVYRQSSTTYVNTDYINLSGGSFAPIYQSFDVDLLNGNGDLGIKLIGCVLPNSGRTARRAKFYVSIKLYNMNFFESLVWGSNGKKVFFDLLIPDPGRINNYVLKLPDKILKQLNTGRTVSLTFGCLDENNIATYYYGGVSECSPRTFVFGNKLADKTETYKNPCITPTAENTTTTVKVDNSDTAITFPTTNIKTGDVVQVVDNSTGDALAHYQYDSTANTWNQVSNITNIYYTTAPIKPVDPPYITNPAPPIPPDSGGGGSSSVVPPPASSGGGGSGGGSSGTDWLGTLLKSLLDGFLKLLNSIVGGVVDVIVGLVTKLVDGITTIINSLFNILKQFLTFDSEFGKFFGSFFSWLPPEIIALVTGGISIMIALAIIKFLRK